MEGTAHVARGTDTEALAWDFVGDVVGVITRGDVAPLEPLVSQQHAPEDYAEEDPGYEDHQEESNEDAFEEDDAYHDVQHETDEYVSSGEEVGQGSVVNKKHARDVDASPWYKPSKKQARCSACQNATLMRSEACGGSAAQENVPAPSYKTFASLESKLYRSRKRVEKSERFIKELLGKVSTLESEVVAKDKAALSVKDNLNNLRHTMTFNEDLVRGVAFCPVLQSTLTPEDEVIVFRGDCDCQCMVDIDPGMTIYKKFLAGKTIKCPACNLVAYSLIHTTVAAASQLFIWQRLEKISGCNDHHKMVSLRKECISRREHEAKKELLAGYKSVMRTIADMAKMESSSEGM